LFMIGGDIPNETPDRRLDMPIQAADGKMVSSKTGRELQSGGGNNFFNIIIKNKENHVIDAAYELPGKNLVSISSQKPTLAWSGAPKTGQRTKVHIGLTFKTLTRNVAAILITLPTNFNHDIQASTDVVNLNKKFPVASSSSWADSSNPSRLRILIDDSNKDVPIPAGTYKWQFPVLIPPNIPPENVWYLSLCSERACYKMDRDEAVIIVSFPVAGFNEGDLSPTSIRPSSAFGLSGKTSLIVSVMVSLLGMLLAGRMH